MKKRPMGVLEMLDAVTEMGSFATLGWRMCKRTALAIRRDRAKIRKLEDDVLNRDIVIGLQKKMINELKDHAVKRRALIQSRGFSSKSNDMERSNAPIR